VKGVPKYEELMSLADLDGLAEGDGERDGLLSEDSEVARSR
jgi:hypothetical protein